MNLITQFGSLENAGTATLILTLVAGILNCFFGYKLLKVWMTLAGILIGGSLGYYVSREFTENMWIPYIAMILAAAFLGIVAFNIYVIGVFIVCFLVGLLIACAVLQPQTSAMFFVCVAVGVVVGVLGCAFVRPMVIISTSLQGGIGIATAAVGLAEFTGDSYTMACGFGLAVVGVVMQFLTTKEKNMEKKEKTRKK